MAPSVHVADWLVVSTRRELPPATCTRSTSTTTSRPASGTTGRDPTDCLRALRKRRLGRNLAHLVNTVEDEIERTVI